MSIGFPSRYAGRCGGCGEMFEAGAEVFYAEPDDVLMVVDCCGEVPEPRPAASEMTPVDQVMPRGKTVKDRCPRCFQIPSSNNVCGCP